MASGQLMSPAWILANVERRMSASISILRDAERLVFCCHSVQEPGLSLTLYGLASSSGGEAK